MNSPVTLALTGDQHAHLQNFLFPGDGKEAVAFLLCGRRDGSRRHRLTVCEIHEVPYEYCTRRTATHVTWSPDYIDHILERATIAGLSVIKVHCHPNGYAAFSSADDEADNLILPMLMGWVESNVLHGSAVMLPSGEMFGRVLRGDALDQIECICVASDDLKFWYAKEGAAVPDFAASHAQAFDEGTIKMLQRLSVGVVGASGSGSPTIEQLVRLGVGEIVIVDDDKIEERNINRILHSTIKDAENRRPKTDVLEAAINRIGLGTSVIALNRNLWDPEVIREIAQCDVLFGCMDNVDGRYLLNTISTFYNIPYFDIGIRLMPGSNGKGQRTIREVCGTVHYLRSGRSSLMSRGLFTMQDVAAAGLARNDPAAHIRQVEDGYIKGIPNGRPAVISVNMFGSSLAVNEFLARLHPFREEQNSAYASVTFSLASMELISDEDVGICRILSRSVGRGDRTPMLGLLELAQASKS